MPNSMARIFARVVSEKGKIVGTGGDEYLDIDITVGDRYLARLTVRKDEDGEFTVFNENDDDISTATGK